MVYGFKGLGFRGFRAWGLTHIEPYEKAGATSRPVSSSGRHLRLEDHESSRLGCLPGSPSAARMIGEVAPNKTYGMIMVQALEVDMLFTYSGFML